MSGDAGRRRTVLVVDDDESVQAAVREELAHREYEVVIAGDGDAALKLLEALRPEVIVLDLRLPKVSGPSVAARMRMMQPRPRLLVCSAVAYAPEIADEVEADGVLLKPFARADLRSEVERLLAL